MMAEAHSSSSSSSSRGDGRGTPPRDDADDADADDADDADDAKPPVAAAAAATAPGTSLDDCIDNQDTVVPIVIALSMCNGADAVEILCVGFVMTALTNVSPAAKELLTASVFGGMLVGGLVCGAVSDHWGRRRTLLCALAVNGVSGVLSACSPSVGWLIAFRVLAGVGIGGSIPVVFTLGLELFPTPQRGQLLSYVASAYMGGAMFTAAVGWLLLGRDVESRVIVPGADDTKWRWFVALASVPAFAACVTTWALVPESPRFLVLQGRYVEAARALNALSTRAATTADALRTEAEHVQLQLELQRRHHPLGSSRHGSRHGSSSSLHGSVVDEAEERGGDRRGLLLSAVADYHKSMLFQDVQLRAVVLTLLLIWFSLSFGSYGISVWITDLFKEIGVVNPYLGSFIFAVANLPGNAVSVLLIERVGRKRLLVWGMALAAVSSVFFAADARNKATVVLCAALFNAFSVVGWNALDCLSVEYFPTETRSTAMGLLSASGRLGAIVAQFVNGALELNVPLLYVELFFSFWT
jgi:MFS family permease